MGLALWLIPRRSTPASSELYDHLRSTTSRLSSTLTPTLSAQPSAPFEPHATLLAGLREGEGGEERGEWTREGVWSAWMEVLEEWRRAQEGSGEGGRRIECELRDVSTRGKYFQSVFLLLSLPEPLRSLHEATRTRLNQTHQPPYMPHVSLLYADIPAEEAQGVIRDMEREGWFEREAGGDGEGVQIRLPSGGAERKVGKIEFDRVELWDCTGEVGGWRCIRGVDL